MLKLGKSVKLKVAPTPIFRKNFMRMKKRGKSMQDLRKVVKLLTTGNPLPGNYKDHDLREEWEGYRGCHIDADWILIYTVDAENNLLILVRTGTHHEVFPS